MDELRRAAADARRMAEHVDSRRSNQIVNGKSIEISHEAVTNTTRERDLMEWRIREEYEEIWRTASGSLPYTGRISSREESIRDGNEEVSDYAYNPFDLSARDRGHAISTMPLRSSDESSIPGRRGDYKTRVIRPSQPNSFDTGPYQPHSSLRRRHYETRDVRPRSRYNSSIPGPHIQRVDQSSTESRHRSSHFQAESRSGSHALDEPSQTHLPPEPQYIPPPGYNTALAESQQVIEAFLNDEYDPPPPYPSPERPRRKDKKKEIRAKDHQKALSWLAGRRRLVGE